MTFDMGNWHWLGECPLEAARTFAARVRYVHCKGVQRQPAKWVAVPLADSAAPWRAVLRQLPRGVPWAIEYPLVGDDLLAVTREQVAAAAHDRQCAGSRGMSAAHAFDVAMFGEMMMLLVADRPGPLEQVQSFHKRTAGAETNVAIGLARLGLQVGWASRLGADSMGRYLLAEMQREGIDCSHVMCDPAQRTGFQFKGRVTDGSDPPVEYHRKGSAASQMAPADIDAAWLRSARHLHATGVFPAISASRAAPPRTRRCEVMRAAGRTISFDPNLRPDAVVLARARCGARSTRLAFQADWVLPGIEEGRFLTGEDTPRRHRALLPRARREAGGGQARARRAPSSTAPEGSGLVPGFPVRAGGGHGRRRRRLRGRRGQRVARRPQRRERCAAAPGSAPARCRCWATPRACRRARNSQQAGL